MIIISTLFSNKTLLGCFSTWVHTATRGDGDSAPGAEFRIGAAAAATSVSSTDVLTLLISLR
jgi:hypothetical protein